MPGVWRHTDHPGSDTWARWAWELPGNLLLNYEMLDKVKNSTWREKCIQESRKYTVAFLLFSIKHPLVSEPPLVYYLEGPQGPPSFPSVMRERGPKYATCPRSDNLPMAIGWGRGWCQLESSSIYSPDTSVKFYFCPGFWSPDVMSSWLEPQWRPVNPGSPLGPRRGPSRAGAATCRFLARPSPGLHTFKMTHWLGWESIP